MDVSTPAAKGSGMRLAVEKPRVDNVPEDGARLIEFTDPEGSRDTGFALVYDNRRAVMEAGETERFGKVYNEAEARHAGRRRREGDRLQGVRSG